MTMRSTGPSEPVKTSLAPWLSVSRATEAVGYYQAAFGAVELYRLEDDEGSVVVAQLAIGGADFWLQEDADSSPESLDRQSVRMILTVDDPDVFFEQAVAAGATAVYAVHEEHDWRIGRLADPFGHHWEIGKQLR
jgi:PhnB protein